MNVSTTTNINERVTIDTSFLVILKLLGYLRHLCKDFSEVLLSPEVWKESSQFHFELNQLDCIRTVELSDEEEEESSLLHEEFTKHFTGKHLGEIQTLVMWLFGCHISSMVVKGRLAMVIAHLLFIS